MNKFFKKSKPLIFSFAKDEEGAQVVEYSLIIAVISIALMIALQGLTRDGYFSIFVERLSDCLSNLACT
jgi:pilus assembly protein Flp/PilA